MRIRKFEMLILQTNVIELNKLTTQHKTNLYQIIFNGFKVQKYQFYRLPAKVCGKVLFSAMCVCVCVCVCVCLFTGGSHVTITHDVLDLTIPGPRPITTPCPTYPLPTAHIWQAGGSHPAGMFSCFVVLYV